MTETERSSDSDRHSGILAPEKSFSIPQFHTIAPRCTQAHRKLPESLESARDSVCRHCFFWHDAGWQTSAPGALHPAGRPIF
jgi:hypothetical protein